MTIEKIIIHCSATPEGIDLSAAKIDKWHRKRGWLMIGYHYVIKLDGSIELGRPHDMQGAHTKGQNDNSLGVCYIGGMDRDMKDSKDTRTDNQKESLLLLLKTLKKIYPKAKIHGHRDFAAKACPSFDATEEYSCI